MYSCTLSLTSELDGGWATSRPGRYTPEKHPVTIAQEPGIAPGLFWTYEENLAPTGIRFTDHPARSESLYRARGQIYTLF